jgi:hypothetical protein
MEVPPNMRINVDEGLKAILWQQFGAAILMLENAIQTCPDRIWGGPSTEPQGASMSGVGFWYVAYHTLFWLDYYLSESEEPFAPPAPFTLSEFGAGELPARVYTKAELQAYLTHGRDKCKAVIATMTDAKANRLHSFPWGEISSAELLLYNMRHVQHHAAQLNLILRQTSDFSPGWVCRAKVRLDEA